jgi:DNA-binding transcriptional MerR regulator
MSKLSGASIRSLRYYEKMNILEPAFVDPDSGYRYYSFGQIYQLAAILFCIELDIPLKEFPQFKSQDDTMDYRAFLGRGKEIAEKKLSALKKGMGLIHAIEQQIDLADSHRMGEIYTREFPAGVFYVRPCSGPLEDLELLEIIEFFHDMPYAEEDYTHFPEYGFLHESTPTGSAYYAFAEAPKQAAANGTRIIPAGLYLCRQSEERQLEHAFEIFKEHLAGKQSYLAIETEIFTGKHKMNKPTNELRVIGL